MINGVIKFYQRVCKHDYQCYGEFHYVMSMRSETVYICKKCAYDNSYSVPMGSDPSAVNFTYEPN